LNGTFGCEGEVAVNTMGLPHEPPVGPVIWQNWFGTSASNSSVASPPSRRAGRRTLERGQPKPLRTPAPRSGEAGGAAAPASVEQVPRRGLTKT
jgi:hypothetical protein